MHLAGSPDRWPRIVAGDKLSLADALDRLCIVAACRDHLHTGTLWYPDFMWRLDVPPVDSRQRTLFVAALLASDCHRELVPDDGSGVAMVTDEVMKQFRAWFDDIPPWEVPSRRPLDLVIEALAKGEIAAIGRPKGRGEEWPIPPEFWERRPGEAFMVLASCAIDSRRDFEPSVAFDSDVLIVAASFQAYLEGFAARMREKRDLTHQEIVEILERYRVPYEERKFGMHQLIAMAIRDHHLKDRNRIRSIAKALPWKRRRGRQPRKDG